MYEQIDKLRDGDERSCDECEKILKSKYFPYKSIDLCLWCYEKNHSIILHTLRKKLRLAKSAVSPSKILRGLVCPYCNEEAIIREGSIYVCSVCNSEVNVKKKHIQNVKPKLCPICQAESLIVDRNGNKVCKNCNKTARIYQKLKIKTKRDHFQRENTLNEITNYLKLQERNNQPIKFYYRSDIKPRRFSDYFLDEKYINVKSEQGYYIKFLIDRIRKI